MVKPWAICLLGLTFPIASGLMAQDAPPSAPSASATFSATTNTPAAFEVASVKPGKSGTRLSSNVPLAPGGGPPPNGGLFSATNYPLVFYIAFAFDLSVEQTRRLSATLPAWAADGFDIEAKASGNPTRAQMQQMMQSLLADRFKLEVHHETQPQPAFALVRWKADTFGPLLRPHVDVSCTGIDPGAASVPAAATAASAARAADFPPACSAGLVWMPSRAPGLQHAGARNVTMAQLANLLPVIDAKDGVRLDRPVIDRTGLSGSYDFAIEFAFQFAGALPTGADLQLDPAGPPFVKALQDELGLKLEPITAPVDALVVDHVEPPTPN